MKHINLLNAVALVSAQSGGAAMSPDLVAIRRAERRERRIEARRLKHMSWPACGARAQARYGRQVAQGRLKAENGLVVE